MTSIPRPSSLNFYFRSMQQNKFLINRKKKNNTKGKRNENLRNTRFKHSFFSSSVYQPLREERVRVYQSSDRKTFEEEKKEEEKSVPGRDGDNFACFFSFFSFLLFFFLEKKQFTRIFAELAAVFYHFLDLDPPRGPYPSRVNFHRSFVTPRPLSLSPRPVNEVNATHESLGYTITNKENTVIRWQKLSRVNRTRIGKSQDFSRFFLRGTRLQACYY